MNDITINEIPCTFKESFDMNLTLDYENTSWHEWHIVREFLSNALDSVNQDTSKVNVSIENGYVQIRDLGKGYPLAYAKRIGASSKKNDPESIGQFGEGIKMAVLTCVRLGIKVVLASWEWLAIPCVKESDGQQVLFYEVYQSLMPITGSLVLIEATDDIQAIVRDLPQYFLHYKEASMQYGNGLFGIYPFESVGKLYNKGVYIKDIKSLFSYGLDIAHLNRDRDLVDMFDIAYQVRELWEQVDDSDLIDVLLKASNQRTDTSDLVEFYLKLRTDYPSIWAERFLAVFGSNACIATNDIASREAVCMGFIPVMLHHNNIGLLVDGGVKQDTDCLSADYEFVWAHQLTREEEQVKASMQRVALMLKLPAPDKLKVFEEYRNHAKVEGAFNPNEKSVYIKRECLTNGLSHALNVYLHELTHFITGADDLSRDFAESLCRSLTDMSISYISAVGWAEIARIDDGQITLPECLALMLSDMKRVSVALFGRELHIITKTAHICFPLPVTCNENVIKASRITVKKSVFTIRLPEAIRIQIPDWLSELPCYVRDAE